MKFYCRGYGPANGCLLKDTCKRYLTAQIGRDVLFLWPAWTAEDGCENYIQAPIDPVIERPKLNHG